MISPSPAGAAGPSPLRKALVTGAAGFLGTALARRLAAGGTSVVGVDRVEPRAAAGQRFLRADLLACRDLVEQVVALAADGPEEWVAFHLAGESHVGSCRRDPVRAHALNVTTTVNLLEACRAAGIMRVVLPSTALVYGTRQGPPADEEDPVAPATIYAATKLAAEQILGGYATEYGLSGSVARLGNVYGAGGHADSVVSRLLGQALRGGPIAVGRLAPQRDFIFRDDVTDGLVAIAAACPEEGFRVFNLSSGKATAIGELALAVCRAADLPPEVAERDAPGSGADDRLVLSIRRLAERVRWRPAWSLEAGLRQALREMRKEEHE